MEQLKEIYKLSIIDQTLIKPLLPSNISFNLIVTDSNNPFYGNRYVLGSDISTRLLFDNNGVLAGIQATVCRHVFILSSNRFIDCLYLL